MKSFKEHYYGIIEERESIAKSIIDDITVLIRDAESMRAARVLIDEYMGGVSGEELGKGAYSKVYGGSSGGYIVKVAMDDNKFNDFVVHTGKHDNPFLPKVVASTRVDYMNDFGPYYIDLYVMEKLQVDFNRNTNLIEELQTIEGFENEDFISIVPKMIQDQMEYENGHRLDAFLKKYNRTYDQLYEFGQILYDINQNYKNDIHRGNFGFDSSGGIVIFDPLS